MIDFHTHILPGIDDGSKDLQTSLQMLRMEARQGITEVIATSHFYGSEGGPRQYLRRRDRAWEQLAPHLNDDMPVVRLGAEVQYFEGICLAEDIELLRIQGSDLLLLEMPTRVWTNRMLDDIVELNSRPGMQVVLAHIDRYAQWLPKGLVEQLVNAGILIQANVSVFADWRTAGKAKRMLKKDQLHFFGSDCHSMNHRCPNWDRISGKMFAQLEAVSEHYMREFFAEDPCY